MLVWPEAFPVSRVPVEFLSVKLTEKWNLQTMDEHDTLNCSLFLQMLRGEYQVAMWGTKTNKNLFCEEFKIMNLWSPGNRVWLSFWTSAVHTVFVFGHICTSFILHLDTFVQKHLQVKVVGVSLTVNPQESFPFLTRRVKTHKHNCKFEKEKNKQKIAINMDIFCSLTPQNSV